jgi:sphingolipid delta-4 desaturase
MRAGYTVTAKPNPHIARGAAIRRLHPEVRRYFHPDPVSRWCVVGVVGLQLALAFVLRDAPWWLVLLAAFGVGAFASHALFVLIHDACHNLIGRGTLANRWWGILCNVGQGFPSAMPFRTFHLLHHSRLDEYDWDGDLAFHFEARLVGNAWWRKALWLALFPLVEVIRPMRIGRPVWDRWQWINLAVVLASDALVLALLGPKALVYVVGSTIFGLGLHPCGARWIQEHYTVVPGQETYSYYGPINRVAFNIGYHNEHHDLPAVPWRHLPHVKALAPEFYDGLYAHPSYTRLLLRFLFDRDLDLYSRITRERPALRRVAPADEAPPALRSAAAAG